MFSTDFATIDTTLFDTNYPASLTIQCQGGVELDLFGGAFVNMSHLQWVKVCTVVEICIGR